MILLWVIIPLFIIYSILIIYYWQSWEAIPQYLPSQRVPVTSLSVIIPARNEEKHIGSLLMALQHQTYPKELVDIVVIDDHSDDRTAEIANQFNNVRLLQLKDDNINSYKKKAVETGIASSAGEWIVTTDADCLPPEDWLRTMAAFKEEKQAMFVAAPVVINCDSSIVQVFQAMDFMVLQGITGAVVHKKKLSMCNGANLGYEKTAFYEVNGFTGIDQIASGDDMLLMHKVEKRYPSGTFYLKSKQAIVSTQPVNSWKSFFSQRIRWASKALQYNDRRVLPVLILVYLFNLSFVFLIAAGFWDHRYWLVILALWLLKTIIEIPFFSSLAVFFNRQWMVKWFFFLQPLHVFYTIISGFLGQFGKYEWKGRRVK